MVNGIMGLRKAGSNGRDTSGMRERERERTECQKLSEPYAEQAQNTKVKNLLNFTSTSSIYFVS
jgi:hypothetical protein